MHANALRVLLLIPVLIFLTRQDCISSTQDIMGGAAVAFVKRPENPPVRRRPSKGNTAPGQSNSSISDKKPTENSQEVKSDMSDEVEDVLALANSARDASPPRNKDAELAYRLASKLNPKDPRSYVGLGNIWYDQKQYAEAAEIYKKALTLMASESPNRTWTLRGQLPLWSEEAGEWRSYLGNTLLQSGNFSQAELEFREAISLNSKNANWHAQLGYCLLKQNKFAEAAKSLKVAVRLDPKTAEYKQLLQLSLNRRK